MCDLVRLFVSRNTEADQIDDSPAAVCTSSSRPVRTPRRGRAAIARRVGRPLLICGPVQDETYFADQVEPHVDGHAVTYAGNVDGEERVRVLSQAAALLHPLGFDEPFGLSVVEAMVCGTPVVGYRRGALAETVTVGVTGYLVDNVDGAVAAVAHALELDRARVAAEARRQFSADRMVDDYLTICRRLAVPCTLGTRVLSLNPWTKPAG